MRVSRVQAQLTGSDILSVINEFLEVEGLILEKVIIDRNIKVKGSFSKGLSIDFEGELEVIGAKENKVHLKFAKFKAFKLGFFRQLRSFGLRMVMKNIDVDGIDTEKDEIIIDIDKVLFKVPYVELNISEVYVKGSLLHAEVEDVNLSLKGNIIKVAKEEEEDIEEGQINLDSINKVTDSYSAGRKTMEAKIPEPINLVSDYLFVIPDIIALVYRLLKDNRVSLKTKITISASVAYVVVPSDILPSKIPFIGKIDDLAVIFFALNRIVNDVPLNILLENWEGKNELILVLMKGLDYIINFTGAKNVEKLYGAINQLKTL